MRVVRNALFAQDLPAGSVVTIGNYDGIHRGQRAILERVRERAAATDLPAVVVTFDPHPLSVLRPERAPRRLSAPADKECLLRELGLDLVLYVSFTPEFARTTARSFVEEFLVARLGAREVYVGSRFVFGRQREGNLALLESMGRDLGFRAVGVPELLYRGEPVSSTRIRTALRSGEVEEAASMLGRCYDLRGTVVAGARRGRQLGWPTLNLEIVAEIVPARGVYASRVFFEDSGERLASVTNIGVRPTVGAGEEEIVEAHVLDFRRDVYGQRVRLEFVRRLRDERRFETLEALSTQIGRDVTQARECLEAPDDPPTPVAGLGGGREDGA